MTIAMATLAAATPHGVMDTVLDLAATPPFGWLAAILVVGACGAALRARRAIRQV